MADEIGVLHDGRIQQWDSAVQPLPPAGNRFVADFVGQGVFLPASALTRRQLRDRARRAAGRCRRRRRALRCCCGRTTWCTTTPRRRRPRWCTRRSAAPRSSTRCASRAAGRCWRWCRATTTMRSASDRHPPRRRPRRGLSARAVPVPSEAVDRPQLQRELLAAQRRGQRHRARRLAEHLQRLPVEHLVARAPFSVTEARPSAPMATPHHHVALPVVLARERRIALVAAGLVDQLHAVLVARQHPPLRRRARGCGGAGCRRRRGARRAGAGAGGWRGGSPDGAGSTGAGTGFGAALPWRAASALRALARPRLDLLRAAAGAGGRGCGGSIRRATIGGGISTARRARVDELGEGEQEQRVQHQRREDRVVEDAIRRAIAHHPRSARQTFSGVSGISRCGTLERIEHRVHHRGHRADRAELAAALHAEKVGLAGHALVEARRAAAAAGRRAARSSPSASR